MMMKLEFLACVELSSACDFEYKWRVCIEIICRVL